MFTILFGTDQPNPTFPYTLKTQINDSNLEVFIAAISRLAGVDTAITTGIRTGITNHNAASTTGTFDNFVESDLDVQARSGLLQRQIEALLL